MKQAEAIRAIRTRISEARNLFSAIADEFAQQHAGPVSVSRRNGHLFLKIPQCTVDIWSVDIVLPSKETAIRIKANSPGKLEYVLAGNPRLGSWDAEWTTKTNLMEARAVAKLALGCVDTANAIQAELATFAGRIVDSGEHVDWSGLPNMLRLDHRVYVEIIPRGELGPWDYGWKVGIWNGANKKFTTLERAYDRAVELMTPKDDDGWD